MTLASPMCEVPAEIVEWFEKVLAEERMQMKCRHRAMLVSLQAGNGGLGRKVGDQEDACTTGAMMSDEDSSEAEDPGYFRFPEDMPQTKESTTESFRDRDPTATQNSLVSKLTVHFDKSRVSSGNGWHLSVLASSTRFEVFFAGMIVLSCIVMSVEAQYNGMKVGYDLKYTNTFPRSPVIESALEVCEMIFGVLFLIEVLIKIVGQRLDFIKAFWNWFDSLLVLFWLVDVSLKTLPINGSWLRLTRLVRLLRLLRLVRAMQGFDSLVMMTTALQGSIASLFWVAVLLLLVQMMFALLLNQMLMYYMQQWPEGDEQALKDRQEIFRFFGTFSRSMLTMFELTLGNWVPVARALQENVSGYFVIFSIAHKVSFGFACVGVINGVFMQETLKVAQLDDAMLMRTAQKLKELHLKKMTEFLKHTDTSGDGKISYSEWKHCLKSEFVHHWFSGQGLSLRDADRLFAMIESDGDGKLSLEELVTGVSRLQGTAKSLDLACLQEELGKRLEEMSTSIWDELKHIREHMAKSRKQLAKADVARRSAPAAVNDRANIELSAASENIELSSSGACFDQSCTDGLGGSEIKTI